MKGWSVIASQGMLCTWAVRAGPCVAPSGVPGSVLSFMQLADRDSSFIPVGHKSLTKNARGADFLPAVDVYELDQSFGQGSISKANW